MRLVVSFRRFSACLCLSFLLWILSRTAACLSLTTRLFVIFQDWFLHTVDGNLHGLKLQLYDYFLIARLSCAGKLGYNPSSSKLFSEVRCVSSCPAYEIVIPDPLCVEPCVRKW